MTATLWRRTTITRWRTLAIACLTALACDSPTAANDPNVDFFPLTAGNRWVYGHYNQKYSTGGAKEVWQVTGEVKIGDHMYSEITRTPDWTHGSWRSYFRLSGDTLYHHLDPETDTISFHIEPMVYLGIYAVFSLRTGETFQFDRADMTYEALVVDHAENSIVVRYDDPGWADDAFSVTFERGIGITRIYSNDWALSTELLSYELEN